MIVVLAQATPAGPTGYDYLSLAVGALGLVLAVGGLVWQVATWRFTRPIVRVDAGDFVVVGPDVGAEFVVRVRVRNVGGAPITVTTFGFESTRWYETWRWSPFKTKKAKGFVVTQLVPGSSDLRHRLEPGADAMFLV